MKLNVKCGDICLFRVVISTNLFILVLISHIKVEFLI